MIMDGKFVTPKGNIKWNWNYVIVLGEKGSNNSTFQELQLILGLEGG
jgi:hypothetical protein